MDEKGEESTRKRPGKVKEALCRRAAGYGSNLSGTGGSTGENATASPCRYTERAHSDLLVKTTVGWELWEFS